MKHKMFKLLIAVVMVFSAFTAYAEDIKVGLLMPAKLVAGLEESTQSFNIVLWQMRAAGHQSGKHTPRFYSNLATMLMALNAGEINAFSVSQPVGEYITAMNPELEFSYAARITGASFVFGFRAEDGKALCGKFNSALAEMKKDGTLDALRQEYCGNPGKDIPAAVKFEKFSDAETVSIAVTGDVPPMDYVAADGEAAGFNTAILSEIGKRLKLNIKLVYVETAARTTALMSKRADCVFWYQVYKDSKSQPDTPESVIFSEPYYDFNIFLHVSKKHK